MTKKKNINEEKIDDKDPCKMCGSQRCPGDDEAKKTCEAYTGKEPEYKKIAREFFEKHKMPILTDKDKLAIYSNIATGPYSKECAYNCLEDTFDKLGMSEMKFDNMALTTKHIQIIDNVLSKLIEKVEKRTK